MRTFLLCCIALLTGTLLCAQVPASPKQPVTDTYFGRQVTDSYRWLENTKDTVVKTWLKGQADYTTEQLIKSPEGTAS